MTNEAGGAILHRNNSPSGNILVIVIGAILLFLLCLYFCLRWYLKCARRRVPERNNGIHPNGALGAKVSKGLDATVLNMLPTFSYSKTTSKEMLDCAVCLLEFEEHEKVRLLPRCKHSFHSICIDMWFGSHSTCPICRMDIVGVEVHQLVPARREPAIVPISINNLIDQIEIVIESAGSEPGSTWSGSSSRGSQAQGGRYKSFRRSQSNDRKDSISLPCTSLISMEIDLKKEGELAVLQVPFDTGWLREIKIKSSGNSL